MKLKKMALWSMVVVLLVAAPAMALQININPTTANVTEGGTFKLIAVVQGQNQDCQYAWSQTEGPTAGVTQSTTQPKQLDGTAPSVNANARMTFQVMVTKPTGSNIKCAETGIVSSYVNVLNNNSAPTANITVSPAEVYEGTVVEMKANGYDADGDTLTYLWEQPAGPAVTLSNTTDSTVYFTAPNDPISADGVSLEFKVTVKDTSDSIGTSTKAVTVKWFNDPPKPALACTPAAVDEGKVITLDGSGSTDNDDGIASYVWSQPLGYGGASIALPENTVTSKFDITAASLSSKNNKMTFALKVTDNGGLFDYSTCDILVNDTTPPEFSRLPADITAEATSASGAAVIYTAPTATDAVDGIRTVTCDPVSGSTFALDATTKVTCSATDESNNKSEAYFNVKVLDTTPPVIEAHADVAAEATSKDGATVAYVSPATSDAVDGAGTATCLPAAGSTFALGDTIVTCTASDKAGNTATATTFKITVKDTTPPVIAAHEEVTAEATSKDGATVAYASPATSDAVDGAGTATCLPAAGSTFALGDTTVTCKASDKAGNIATATTFMVTVRDTTPPVIAAHANLTAEATSASGATVTYTSPTTSDVVDGAGTATCTPASGSTFALGDTTVNCKASDKAGNTAIATTFTMTVQDTTPPTIKIPENILVIATSVSGAAVTYTPTAIDLVDGAVTVSCDKASGSTFAPGTTGVTCSATDAHNNIAKAGFSVAVNYGFNGLLSPYSQGKAYKIKSAIPLKWQYTSNTGAALPSSTSKPTVLIYQISNGVDTSSAIELDDAGTSGYQYDNTTNTWQFNLKTTGLAVGTYDIYIQNGLTGQKDCPYKIQLVK